MEREAKEGSKGLRDMREGNERKKNEREKEGSEK